ncbi:hypothetical protein EOL70_13195 [Leucothrix sargassi]|nr:hypothetical protein EOL70_13195 [Leucothrix sargassi]
MYIFSVTAKAKNDINGFEKGATAPFIVYIDFADLTGAEYLARYYVTKEGFFDISIDKRRELDRSKVKGFSQKNAQVKEAIKTGYAIQLFEQD